MPGSKKFEKMVRKIEEEEQSEKEAALEKKAAEEMEETAAEPQIAEISEMIKADTAKLQRQIMAASLKNKKEGKKDVIEESDLERLIRKEEENLIMKLGKEAQRKKKPVQEIDKEDPEVAKLIEQTEKNLRKKILEAAKEKGIELDKTMIEKEAVLEKRAAEDVAEEMEETIAKKKKGFLSSMKNRFASLRGKKGWEKAADELEEEEKELVGKAEKAEAEFKEEVEEILSAEDLEKKSVLDKAREKFSAAKAKLKKYEGIRGALRRLKNKVAAVDAEAEVEYSKDKYLEARAEFVAGKVERHLEESMKLADAQADAFQKERGFGRKIYDAYKKLGDWNLTKLGIKPKSKIGKMIARAASVRTLIGAGLVAGGSALAAVGAAGTAAGMFVARRAMGGLGAGIGSYDLMKMIANKKLGKEVKSNEAREMSDEDLRKRLEYFEAVGPMNGKKPSEIPAYKVLKREYGRRLNENLNVVELAKREGEEPESEMYEKTKEEVFREHQEYIQELVVRELKLLVAFKGEKQAYKKAKTKKEKNLIRNHAERLSLEIDQLSKEIGDQTDVDDIIIQFQEKNNLFVNPMDALSKTKEGIGLKPEYEKKLIALIKENENIQNLANNKAEAIMRESQEQMEQKDLADKALAVNAKLLEMAKGDLDEIEKRRKKAKKNDRVMKVVAAGIGSFVGSGGVRWLLKETGFIGEPADAGITGKKLQTLGIEQDSMARIASAEAKMPPVTSASTEIGPEVEMPEEFAEPLPRLELSPSAEGVTSLQKGEGMIKGINRILEENPSLKSEIGDAKAVRAWRLEKLKELGYDTSKDVWEGAYTVKPGDQISVVRADDGALHVEVQRLTPKGVALSLEDYQDKFGPKEIVPRHLPMTPEEKLRATMYKQLEWAFSEKGPKTFDEEVLKQLEWAFSEKGPKTFDEEMLKQLEWAFSEKGPKTFDEEMQGQLTRWFTGAESQTVPPPGLDEKIAAAKAAREAAEAAAAEGLEPTAPAEEVAEAAPVPSGKVIEQGGVKFLDKYTPEQRAAFLRDMKAERGAIAELKENLAEYRSRYKGTAGWAKFEDAMNRRVANMQGMLRAKVDYLDDPSKTVKVGIVRTDMTLKEYADNKADGITSVYAKKFGIGSTVERSEDYFAEL